MSRRTSVAPRAKKRSQVRAACNECRARKVACDTTRPVCKQCSSRWLDCVYETRDPEETRQEALRRENESLRGKVQEMQDFVDHLKSMPATDALELIRHRRQNGDSTLHAFRADSLQRHADPGLRFMDQHLRVAPAMPMTVNLQVDLLVNHSKAYPSILAFEDAQSIARTLLSPWGSQRIKITRMKLDVHGPDQKENTPSILFCDPRLEKLKISHWTDVPISNYRAAAAISHYLQTEHPLIALFNASLFVGDLVGRRERYCSPFLVNALLAYAMQAYAIYDSTAWDLHARFFAKAITIWETGATRDIFIDLIALKMMDYAGATGGFDLEARRFNQCAKEMAERLGLFNGSLLSAQSTIPEISSHDARWDAHAAWGYFASACTSSLLYMQRFPKAPLSYPIPGTHGFHLPWYMGSTFTSMCKLFVIVDNAMTHSTDAETPGPVPLAVAESTYGKLLEWVNDLPSCCARSDMSTHHVITMHIYYHCIVILFIRPWTSKNLHLRPSPAIHTTPDAVFQTSIRHMKRILVLFQLHYPESRYHAWWAPAAIYVAHAVLTASPPDPEWRFYFLLCLQAYRHLALAYPFAAVAYKATLTMAIAEGKLSAAKARDFHRQLVQGKGREGVKDAKNLRVYIDLSHARKENESRNAEELAGDLERLTLVRGEARDGADAAVVEVDDGEEWAGLSTTDG